MFDLIGTLKKERIMETPTSKSPHTLFWIAGTAVTVFSAVGIAAVMGWIPTSTSSDRVVLTQPAAPVKPAAPVAQAKTQAQLQAEAQARADAREQAEAKARAEARAEDRAEARADKRDQARADKRAASAQCANCGVIESIREVEAKGAGTGLGAAGGAVVGGVLGNQVGDGSGRRIATVAGAVGGAVAGHQIEKHVKSTKSYEITVRYENGSSSVIHADTAPSWRTGDRVKVTNGVISSNA
jgi:outer membrane lipoprotein SlyB